MRYTVAPRPDWRTTDGGERLVVGRHHAFEADSPDAVVVVPEGMPTWLRLRRADLEAIRNCSGLTVESLRAGAGFDRIVAVLDRLYDAGLLFVGGATGVSVLPTAAVEASRPGKPASLLIKMTGACDIACDYCYDYDPRRWKSGLDMDLARRLIDECLEPRRRLTIMFHGGEPLLQFARIRELVAHAEASAARRGAEIRFSLQTNGLGLTAEIVDFLQAHPFGVGISLDGPASVHDVHRVDHRGRGTFSRLAEKFEHFPQFMREHVGYISVATNKTLPLMDEAWRFFERQQVLTWKILPSEPEGRAAGEAEHAGYVGGFVSFLRRRIAEIRDGRTGPPYIANLTQLIAPLLSLERRNMCMKAPCGAGTDLLVLDARNQLRGCDCTYHPAFLLDRDDAAADLAASALGGPAMRPFHDRERWLMEEADCRKCPWLHFCAGTCPARALVRKGTIFAVDDLECVTRQELFPEIAADLASPDSRLAAYYRGYAALNAGPAEIGQVD